MRFYKRDIKGLYLPGIIWNPQTSRRWCSFDEGGGVVETDNPQLIEVLLKYGYPHDEVKVVKVEPEEALVELEEEVKEEVAKEEISENFFVEETDDADSIGVDAVINTEAPTPKYKTKTELKKALNVMTKKELEAYAREEFGVELDKRHSWTSLQKEAFALGETALEK